MEGRGSEFWRGIAAARQRAAMSRGGGWRAWVILALLAALTCVIVLLLLPIVLLLVVIGAAVMVWARVSAWLSGVGGASAAARDDEGRENVRVRVANSG